MKNKAIFFLLFSILIINAVHSQNKDVTLAYGNDMPNYYTSATINTGNQRFVVLLDSINLMIKNVKKEIIFNKKNNSGVIHFSLIDFNNDGIMDIQLNSPTMPCEESEIVMFDKNKIAYPLSVQLL